MNDNNEQMSSRGNKTGTRTAAIREEALREEAALAVRVQWVGCADGACAVVHIAFQVLKVPLLLQEDRQAAVLVPYKLGRRHLTSWNDNGAPSGEHNTSTH